MASKDNADPILASEQRLKYQKQIVHNLHRQLKEYNQAFRHFINAEKAFYETLDNICESSWELKAQFSRSLQSLGNIAENGVRNLETIPVEETIVFRDQFGPYEKEIQDYKEKQKVADAAEKKHTVYMKKKACDADELRKLELAAYEKKTSLGILRRKLTDELPSFYKSRMDYYSTFWRSVFQIRADIARAEFETLDQLTEMVRGFDGVRNQEDAAPGQVAHMTTSVLQLRGSDSAVASELVSQVGADDEEFSGDGGPHPEQPEPQKSQPQPPSTIRRVPTFGGNDMVDSEVSGNRCKPPVPRRSSFRLYGKDKT